MSANRPLADIPGITVRVIEYPVTSEDGSETSETFTLVTDLLDPALLTPEQAAAAYASRWQLETCFDELETSLRGGTAVVLRSKSPPMIRQEIYAMLCHYQAIGTLISHAAGRPGPGPGLLHPRPRRNPEPHQRLRKLFPLTASTTSPPTWPSRSPSPATSYPNAQDAATSARPNGPAAGTRPANPARPPG